MDLSNLTIIRLSENFKIENFDCDDDDLNDFFLNNSKKYSDQLLAVTYIIQSDGNTIAFFSIFNDKISIKEIKNPNDWKEFQNKHFPPEKSLASFPAVKIGRLGVNKAHQKQGIGKIIIDYLIDSFITSNKTGCRFITVDAYKESLSFYEKTGFDYLTEKDVNKDTRLMFLDLHQFYLNI